MFQMGDWALLACVLLGCSHGYAVKLNATRVDRVEPVVISRLSDAAISRGLTATMLAHRNADAPNRDLTSSFRKEISAQPNDAIQMDIVYADRQSPDQRIFVFIENIVTGAEAPIKRQIDSLADECYQVLVEAFGPENVIFTKGSATLPWFR